uniref:collectin-12-like isoform X2 n=1 Tax=Styela clava TaxID=7725 RepID=UPI001939D543|nr:collectin-12-like isoform X2 [Styela clava]
MNTIKMMRASFIFFLICVVITEIKSDSTCSVSYDRARSKMHLELDWLENAQGLQGRPGKRGIPGITGEKGTQGQRGEKGEQGIIGPKGNAGMVGQPGPKGEVSQEYLANLEAKMLKFASLPWVEVNERFSYFSSYFSMTWDEGKIYCGERNAKLAHKGLKKSSILSLVQNNEKLIAPSNHYWIGIYLIEGDFKWLDGAAVDSNIWNTLQEFNCGILKHGLYGVHREQCNYRMKVLCEFELK